MGRKYSRSSQAQLLGSKVLGNILSLSAPLCRSTERSLCCLGSHGKSHSPAHVAVTLDGLLFSRRKDFNVPKDASVGDISNLMKTRLRIPNAVKMKLHPITSNGVGNALSNHQPVVDLEAQGSRGIVRLIPTLDLSVVSSADCAAKGTNIVTLTTAAGDESVAVLAENTVADLANLIQRETGMPQNRICLYRHNLPGGLTNPQRLEYNERPPKKVCVAVFIG